MRLYPVGRLDMYSEGLLIMTDDGDFANRLMHPSSGNEQDLSCMDKQESAAKPRLMVFAVRLS